MSLRDRVREFLSRKPPEGLSDVPGSVAEMALAAYADGQPLDEEMRDLLELCIPESRDHARSLTGAAKAYLLESAGLLEEISRER